MEQQRAKYGAGSDGSAREVGSAGGAEKLLW
jgi:hypothetical protein